MVVRSPLKRNVSVNITGNCEGIMRKGQKSLKRCKESVKIEEFQEEAVFCLLLSTALLLHRGGEFFVSLPSHYMINLDSIASRPLI